MPCFFIQAKIPIAFKRKEKKIVKAETMVVHTTGCPARPESAPISCAMGTLETAAVMITLGSTRSAQRSVHS